MAECDATAIRDLLLACGATSAQVRGLTWAALYQQQAERRIAAMGAEWPGVWWAPDPPSFGTPALEALDRELRANADRLGGDLPEHSLPWRERRLDFLPPEKRAKLSTIKADYDALREKGRSYAALPEDRERQKLLEQEEERDIRALLSADEWAEYLYRNDSDVRHLGERFARFPLSEAEFRELVAIEKARAKELEKLPHDITDPFAPQSPTKEHYRTYQEIIAQADARMRNLIGVERMALGERESSAAFRKMLAYGDRLKIPRATLERNYELLRQGKIAVEAIPPEADDTSQAQRATLCAKIKSDLARELGVSVVEELSSEWELNWLR